MFRLLPVIPEVLGDLRGHLRPLLVWHLFFTLLAVALVVPATAWLSTALLTAAGTPAVSNEDLLRFLLTLRGMGWSVLAGAGALTLVFVQHAGMLLIAKSPEGNRYWLASSALWLVGRQLHRLLALALMQVVAHLVLALPFLLALTALGRRVLAIYDPYYLLVEQPPAFWLTFWLGLPLCLLMLLGNVWLYLRWSLSLPALLLEKLSPLAALRRSAQLTRRQRLRLAKVLLLAAAFVASLPLSLSLLFNLLGGLLLRWLPEVFALLVPLTFLFLAAYILFAALIAFCGVAFNALLIRRLYLRLAGRDPGRVEAPPRGTGPLAWGAELLLLLFALGQAGYLLHSFFDFEDRVAVTAHRGSSLAAPENTLAAIEQAIVDGAHFVEIDVRMTADGALVLLHDRDLRRVAGDPRAIWEITLEELQTLDAGAWFDPRFAGQRVPTLTEAVAQIGGRAEIYLEIKTAVATPDLIDAVVAYLQREQLLEQTVVAALDPVVLERVRQLEPHLRTALLVHTTIGQLERLGLHALALRAALASPRELRLARRHGHELHVWTVNDRALMSRMIDLGVDNIITDRPDLLVELLEERAGLSRPEMFAVKLRNWLAR